MTGRIAGRIETMVERYSLYLHIPFCRHRCAYCDFNTYAGQDRYREAYVEALCTEARLASQPVPDRLPVHTVFFGGGTPSLLRPEEFQSIFQVIRDSMICSKMRKSHSKPTPEPCRWSTCMP